MLGRFSQVTLWTVVLHAPQSMGFSRQEYWSGLPYPPPGDLPDPGIKPVSLISPALAGRFITTSAIWEAPFIPRSVLNALLALTTFSCYLYELVPLLIQFPHLEMKKLRPGEGI